MLMSRKRNNKKGMSQPTTECVDSLTIDDVTGQAVPESGTGRTKCSVADGCVASRTLGTSSRCVRAVIDYEKLIGLRTLYNKGDQNSVYRYQVLDCG